MFLLHKNIESTKCEGEKNIGFAKFKSSHAKYIKHHLRHEDIDVTQLEVRLVRPC